MGLFPSYIIRQAALRVGAYPGIPSAIEALYVAADPTAGMRSASFVPSSMKDQIVAVEQEMTGAVAMNPNHPWRGVIAGVTASIADGTVIPTFASGGTGEVVIGEYGQVRDAVSPNRPLTADLTVAEIRAYRENLTVYKSDVFSFALQKPRLNHTRTNAIIDVCFFDFDARKAAIFADSELLFSEAENCYLTGLLSMLMNTNALLTELSMAYAPRYQAWLAALGAGKVTLD